MSSSRFSVGSHELRTEKKLRHGGAFNHGGVDFVPVIRIYFTTDRAFVFLELYAWPYVFHEPPQAAFVFN